MPLYSYKKAPIKPASYEQKEVIEIKPAPTPGQPLTLGRIIGGMFNDFSDAIKKSRVAGILVPVGLVVIGLSMIYKQVWPDLNQSIRYSLGYYDTSTTALVEGDYVARAQYLSNPGADYFKKLTEDALGSHVLQEDTVSANYHNRFTLSIPALGLNNLPVTANVDSGAADTYNRVLLQGLAHFKGTGLPISDVQNNIVIYGHSSSGDYYERTHDVAGAFSELNKIKIGDEVTIVMDGKKYLYRVSRSKIVDPDDLSIVTGVPDKRTLTLFTCFPNGNSSKRFVAIATPADEGS